MKDYKKGTRIIDSIFNTLLRRNDTAYTNTRNILRRLHRHMRKYWMVYWFLLGKIFASAMIVIGIHFVVAHFNKVLPFGIVSNDMALWFIWAYTGWLIGGCMVAWGIMKLFELTINRWLETL